MSYLLIVILTFSSSTSAITSSTIQVEHKSQKACEAMLKDLTTNISGVNSQVRLARCYER